MRDGNCQQRDPDRSLEFEATARIRPEQSSAGDAAEDQPIGGHQSRVRVEDRRDEERQPTGEERRFEDPAASGQPQAAQLFTFFISGS